MIISAAPSSASVASVVPDIDGGSRCCVLVGAGAGAGAAGGSLRRGMLEMAVIREVRNWREVGRWRVELCGECECDGDEFCGG